MKQTVIATCAVMSLLAVVSGCSGSDSGDDSPSLPPPAGGINGPAVVDPDVVIGQVEGSGG